MSGINPEIENILNEINDEDTKVIKDILNFELQSNSGGGSALLVKKRIREIIDSGNYKIEEDVTEEDTL